MLFSFKYHINLYLLISLVILVSCKLQEPLKTHGIIYLENRSQKLVINKTNQNDVVSVMGKPHIKESQNEHTWIYIERVLTKGRYHKLGKHVLKESNVLVLEFNKFGILEKKSFINKDKINKIRFSEKKTENKLSQKSFVQNLLQSIRQKMYINKK
jgi:outer membrane protein assembly factor BamE (lipoprotein component of BamABCDE complex)|tara:strand:- start:857 stop:1324 length:468 start_codon:yes stop_codon:yes gene_type:complete